MADHNTLSRIIRQLKRAFGQEDASVGMQAGALVWRRAGKGKVEVLLITSRGTGRWVLPKGWLDGGENVAQAAAREAWEEAGVEGTVSDSPLGSYDYVKVDDGHIQPCRVTVHALAMVRQKADWPERGERERQWLPAAEAAERVAEPGLRALLQAFDTDWKKLAA
ncbi:MAG: NUDIX hydrolase [Roseitalea porphyridii]|jgi:8-oxo-dGTP pyrophosphatase MutT (NUDIX family)|uniref:NUDIX hydrolase n=1 Tax=Roseitalea porphyridii TaxID=1852022 RepID=UPI0032ECED1A